MLIARSLTAADMEPANLYLCTAELAQSHAMSHCCSHPVIDGAHTEKCPPPPTKEKTGFPVRKWGHWLARVCGLHLLQQLRLATTDCDSDLQRSAAVGARRECGVYMTRCDRRGLGCFDPILLRRWSYFLLIIIISASAAHIFI